jgi:hypothetical protein
MLTTHDSVLSIRFPFLVYLKQSNSVISTDGESSQLSVAVAVNEIGASGGMMVDGALHEITGGVVSTTLMVCTQLLVFPQ